MSPEETPAQRLQRLIDEDNLLRQAWGDGQHQACLLAALAPECVVTKNAGTCPAEVMPQWLARLTPPMDDKGSYEAWPAMVRRYAAVAARWPALSLEAWERLRVKTLHIIVSEARKHVVESHTTVLLAIDGVLRWLEAGAPEDGREAVRVVAARCWSDAAYAAACAASDASDAVYVASATHAADAAADAAYVARTREVNGVEGAVNVAEDAYDRMTSAILAAIEAECDLAEAP